MRKKEKGKYALTLKNHEVKKFQRQASRAWHTGRVSQSHSDTADLPNSSLEVELPEHPLQTAQHVAGCLRRKGSKRVTTRLSS